LKKPAQDPVINDDEIDITLFKTVNLGGTKYAILKDADMNEDVDIYDITDYVSKTEFKIVSLKPVGIFNNNARKVKKF
jgi:hypothetical protein